MVKNFVVNGSLNLIKENHLYDNERLEEIKFGIESLYLAFSKVIVILTISWLLGLIKESLLLLLLFNILRSTGFGLHASKSIWCWISSTLIFIILPYICKYIPFNNITFIVISIFSLISFILYAPADTVKRPLINAKKRKRYKVLTIIFAIIYVVTIMLIDNNLIRNVLLTSMLIQSILILPFTYKLFGLPYKNYLNYK